MPRPQNQNLIPITPESARVMAAKSAQVRRARAEQVVSLRPSVRATPGLAARLAAHLEGRTTGSAALELARLLDYALLTHERQLGEAMTHQTRA